MTAKIQFDLEGLLLAFVLVGLVLLGVLVIVRSKRWHAAERSAAPPTRLEEYRALMEQGLLEPAEYERIRDHVNKASPDPPLDPSAPVGPDVPRPAPAPFPPPGKDVSGTEG